MDDHKVDYHVRVEARFNIIAPKLIFTAEGVTYLGCFSGGQGSMWALIIIIIIGPPARVVLQQSVPLLIRRKSMLTLAVSTSSLQSRLKPWDL